MKKAFKRRQLILAVTAVTLSAAGTVGMGYRLRVRPQQLSEERTAGVLKPKTFFRLVPAFPVNSRLL